ncbi:MAG: ATPase domain-containing protein [Candidatus Poseidoniales archaeon]|jgi:flagellar protein FlaH
MTQPRDEAPKPVEDGFPFILEQDSLANSMGMNIPNRGLMLIQGPVGGGKSLISQRMIYGLLENNCKVLVITTELTTRGWVEQMESIGYYVTEHISAGRCIVFSRYGIIADSVPGAGLNDILDSPAWLEADVIVLDTGSSLMPKGLDDNGRIELMQRLRKKVSSGRTLIMTADPFEIDERLLHAFRSSCEVVLDLANQLIGGEMKRNLLITRFLRAAGPVQSSVGWRVEPGMGFIVDITAVS